MRGEKFQKVQYYPPTIKRKSMRVPLGVVLTLARVRYATEMLRNDYKHREKF